ncbi:alpha/beta hydrolase family protein [Nocardia sp. AG03]|uniref:alpha/beta hydrolase n=1 Tax=Nocardia sp. AG03 TaxID=3025312 RepID=UPI0024187F19|nr:alpha/beta hydrolase family protein [Nocardia sp. AG03]
MSRAMTRWIVAVVLALAGLPVAVAAQATPETVAARALAAALPAPDGSRAIAAVATGPGRVIELTVFSAAMGRPITVAVLPAADPDAPAGALYLLNGVDGGAETADWRAGGNWFTRTDVLEFLDGAQATVVMPVGGGGTFYADWRAEDPALGTQRWLTFLTAELPPIVDSAFHGTGRDAVAGVSMASSAVFRMAQELPGRFRAIGSFSGCVRTSDPAGQAIVSAIVTARHGDPANLWGAPGDPAWAANDPYLHAERLRGVDLYVSSGNGLPGPLDTLDGPRIGGDPMKLADQLLVGGVLDGITAQCTHQLHTRLTDLAIPATFDFRPAGTHSWGYWQQDLHTFWTRAAEQGLFTAG